MWKHFFYPLKSYNIQNSDNIIYSNKYYPVYPISNSETKYQNACWKKNVPPMEKRINYSNKIKSQIKLKDIYKSKFDKYYEDNLKNTTIIGINFRGTDSRGDNRRIVPKYSIYKNYIDNIIKKCDNNYKIFCTSDEKEFIEYIYSIYPDKTFYNKNSIIGDKKSRRAGVYDCPIFVKNNPFAVLEGALFDYYILTKCHYLIFHQGSIPLSVLLTNPEIIPIPV